MRKFITAVIVASVCVLSVDDARAGVTITDAKSGAIVFSNKLRTVRVHGMLYEVQNLTRDDRNQVLCMAMNAYYEGLARVEHEEMEQVIRVTANRMRERYRGANSYCDVVWHLTWKQGVPQAQFGWTRQRSVSSLGKKSEYRWETAQSIALKVFLNPNGPDPDGFTHFCNPKLDSRAGKLPEWCNGEHKRHIGAHLFVRRDIAN